ncbi:endopeptidase La [Pontibacter sp. BT310]|uniref:Lon protease n=1 Tax=Pontibacter populi TaxID=890055 RepID=A0ABS6X784_9BACT|nr:MULTISPECIES: endopeptidase La [Pontibacter]MBJ6116999.1 endopeptidase La [Pontibacter sp. BT310]MBR0569423.1 endopeptidase La [Microvirga sp. STS03]MBW3363852.1 endopeptidase La [Pontibacter populi]
MKYTLNNFLHNLLLSSASENENEELIPIITTDPEEEIPAEELPSELPILAVRNTVLFPGVVLPITVSRKKSVRLVRKAYKGDKTIGVVAQKNTNADDPSPEDLFNVGTVARILKVLVLPDGNTTIIIQGHSRFQIDEIIQEDPYLTARVSYCKETNLNKKNKEVKALVQSLKDAAAKILKLNPEIPQEAQVALDNIDSPSFLTHFLSSNLNVEVAQKQQLLEVNDGTERGTQLLQLMLREVQLLELKQEIHTKVHTDIDQQQRDYFLRQQIKVLQDELGQESPDQEIERFRDRSAKKKWPEAVAKHFKKEIDKLARLNPQSAEYPVAVNYIEFLLDLPWEDYTKDNFNLKRTKKILDTDHYGLEKVKERILEYLAVLKLKNDMKAPILCLYGPPGVGKTSLGRSIATALGRKYVRMSLGGVRDEAEIRGHRRTYVGAMPGKIISQIKKVGSGNPVIILDEIDKLASDFRGDPSSALLEVLDPEQNHTFMDNYLDVEYDLSKVLFIATANSLDTIQPALRDRMEIIELTGYTMEEKLEIAKRHLVPKQVKDHGLAEEDVKLPKATLQKVIEDYTRESGVRSLERKIGQLVRNTAKLKAMEEEYNTTIKPEDVVKIMGSEIFDKEIYQDFSTAGVVTGLAWTSVGGDILFVESILSKGKGKLTLSGQLGDVMKESAVTALSHLKAHYQLLDIDYRVFDQYDLHIHFPEGAVPKDGPSAGIAIFTSIASVYTQRKVRPKLAMTGEITLRGKVLPVGGIKEKILAAKRAGITDVILCQKNRKDINEIPEQYIKGLTIHYVDRVEEVVKIALLKEKVKHPLDLTVTEDRKVEVE